MRPVVFGVIGHVPPDEVDIFKEHIYQYKNFKVIKISTSDKKLWLVDQKD